jgi:acetyltransferase-like isoleucine patch superfamily enzyme
MNYIFKKVLKIFFLHPWILPSSLICKIRSIYYSFKIDSGGGKIIITEPFINFKIFKHRTSELIIRGRFRVKPHIGGNSPVVIEMEMNSKLEINGDFTVGQGVRFFLASNSTLTIGGKYKESESGMTSDTLVMVYKNVEIGKDFLCAWNIFISDSDWHKIAGQNHQADVVIGDHVWIANSNNILKGTIIGKNCIVASNSKTINKVFPDNVLIGGIPPKILKWNIEWNQDIL